MGNRILNSRHAPTTQVRRALITQLAAVQRELSRRPVPSDNSIHAARKSLKRARATMRLLRPAIGDRQYRLTNGRLRDAAAPLSAVRDAKILLETLNSLKRRLPPISLVSVRALRRVLEHERRMARRGLLRRNLGLRGSIRSVAVVVRSTDRWGKDNCDVHGSKFAVDHAHRKVRSAFAIAKRDPTDPNLHEWRKQTKYFLQELQVLFVKKPRQIAKFIRRSRRLADRLGDDHDLALLRLKARQNAVALGPSTALQTLIESIDCRRATLQKASWSDGKRLCAPGSKQMIRRFLASKRPHA